MLYISLREVDKSLNWHSLGFNGIMIRINFIIVAKLFQSFPHDVSNFFKILQMLEKKGTSISFY